MAINRPVRRGRLSGHGKMNTVAALSEELPARLVELRRCRVDHLDALMTAIESSQTDLARWPPWADPMPTVQVERAFVENLEAAFAIDDWGCTRPES